jgi:hypothetical protein
VDEITRQRYPVPDASSAPVMASLCSGRRQLFVLTISLRATATATESRSAGPQLVAAKTRLPGRGLLPVVPTALLQFRRPTTEEAGRMIGATRPIIGCFYNTSPSRIFGR